MSEHRADIALSKQRCATTPDPVACAKQAREQLLDEQRADARRFLPRCAPMAGESDEECESQAEQDMRAARLARRCRAAPNLSECTARKTAHDTPRAAETPGVPNQ